MSVQLRVSPDLTSIISAAQEADVSIHDIQFLRNLESDVLEAISINIDGNDDSKSYFSWILAKNNLSAEVLR